MASIQQEPTGTYHVVVRIEGKRFKRSLKTKIESEAACRRDEIQETVNLIKRNRIQVPSGISIIDFVMLDGKAATKKPEQNSRFSAQITLEQLFKQYFDSLPENAIEATTLCTMKIHQRHLFRIVGRRFDVTLLNGHKLQQYINKRSKESTQYLVDRSNIECGKRTKVSATTIKKEIATLGAVWRWANAMDLVSGAFPNRGLRFPKIVEKPPFQTWGEIERKICRGGLEPGETDLLWECLYLRIDEVNQLLNHVQQNANYSFIYPMFAMAAYTGARRSEIIRARVSDFDFAANVVTIHERKRVKGSHSTRRVSLTQKLGTIMQNWFDKYHPGGNLAFANKKPFDRTPSAISRDQAQSHFRITVADSRWDKIKGWHCLRHSFISNLACAGIDQRIIDEFAGHSTEEMRRRYRHLFPNVKHAAISRVFG